LCNAASSCPAAALESLMMLRDADHAGDRQNPSSAGAVGRVPSPTARRALANGASSILRVVLWTPQANKTEGFVLVTQQLSQLARRRGRSVG
jgi:hypothetical protein